MSDERPEALLKSALEKILYFEARSEALHNDLSSARAEIERLKGELGTASQRELALRRQLAEAEVQVTRSHRDREELGRMNDALRAERAGLIEKLIEAARIHGADVERDDGFDLASFIAQLRSEAMATQPTVPALPVVPPPPAPAPNPFTFSDEHPVEPVAPAKRLEFTETVEHAARLRSEGRLEVNTEHLATLTRATTLPGRTEETLFGFSLRELSAPDAAARMRAAERLKALGQTAAAPALASALHNETDARAIVAMLSAFADLAGPEGVAVVSRHLTGVDPDVRIAALKALLSLDPSQGGPHLAAAMKDPDAAVRRRATLMAIGLEGEAALKLGKDALEDTDAEVRAVGALALGAGGGEAARGLLLKALGDQDAKVRGAAARSLGRVLGEDVSAVVQLPDAQRRREIRRLATVEAKPVRAAPIAKRPNDRPTTTDHRPPAAAPPAVEAQHLRRPSQAQAVAAAPARARVATLELTQTEPPKALVAEVLTELRGSLRGLTLPDLSSHLGRSAPEVERVCAALTARGEVVRRGIKYFVA